MLGVLGPEALGEPLRLRRQLVRQHAHDLVLLPEAPLELLVSLGQPLVLLGHLVNAADEDFVVVLQLPLEGLLALQLGPEVLAPRLEGFAALAHELLVVELAAQEVRLAPQLRRLLAADLEDGAQGLDLGEERALVLRHRLEAAGLAELGLVLAAEALKGRPVLALALLEKGLETLGPPALLAQRLLEGRALRLRALHCTKEQLININFIRRILP